VDVGRLVEADGDCRGSWTGTRPRSAFGADNPSRRCERLGYVNRRYQMASWTLSVDALARIAAFDSGRSPPSALVNEASRA